MGYLPKPIIKVEQTDHVGSVKYHKDFLFFDKRSFDIGT